jgi:tRNA 2-thiocytidine biosynthesis protein TtcA
MFEIEKDKTYKRIKRLMGKAILDFELIQEGDRICVGVSGGKDSWTLLHMLEVLRRRAPVKFEIVAVTIDAGYAGFRHPVITEHLEKCGFENHVEITDAYTMIEDKKRDGTSYCSFCARLRRGTLTTVAKNLSCNVIALGHHLDDFAETLLLNLFYSGSLSAMAPNYEEERGTRLIRPLVYVEEEDIINFTKTNQLPIVCCACPVCGEIDQKRKRMKRLIQELSKEIPGIRASMLGALGNPHLKRLLIKKGMRED